MSDWESTWTDSTNCTTGNLPGPGRLLGNAYENAGRLLEKQLRRLRAPKNITSPIQIEDHPASNDDTTTISTVSTNFTEDNLAGTGRTLGLLINYAGTSLEKRINRLMEHRSPEAYIRKIKKLRHDDSEALSELSISDQKALVTTFSHFMKYLRYV